MSKYYEPNKLLNMKDLNGRKPAIYICDGNRSSGKTTAFYKLAVDEFLQEGKKFCLFYRYKYELDDCAGKFFDVIKTIFFPNYEMTSKCGSGGMYHYLFIKQIDSEDDPICCGYAVAINLSDKLKKVGNVLCDTETILFDEFQLENGTYCPNEVKKFQSLYYTIARGGGLQSRDVRVIMIGNSTSLMNPYYVKFGIVQRLREDTRFLRGKGWVLEHNFNESASKAINESAFTSAFSDSDYVQYATNNRYLRDSNTFIETPTGKGRYMCTIKCEGHEYGLLEYRDDGFIYVSDKADGTFKFRIAVDLPDHSTNYVLLSHYDSYIANLRFLFDHGSVRFKNLKCKSAFMRLLNYSME